MVAIEHSSIHETIKKQFQEHRETLAAAEKVPESVAAATAILIHAIKNKKHIYACGNGGSTCDAMHLVEELVTIYKNRRPGIAAHNLMDPSIMTCWSNDVGFTDAFRRQIEAYGQEGDVFVGISTSGNSENLYRALEEARKRKMKTVSFLGKTGGKQKGLADVDIIVPSHTTARIQEIHILCIHSMLECIDKEVFGV